MRRAILCAIALCVMSIPAIADLPLHDPVYEAELSNQVFVPGFGLGQAFVSSTVYSLAGDSGYLYTYQISGATTPFTWFSIALDPAISIIDSDYEGTVNTPWFFLPVGTDADPTSIEAYFNPGLTNGTSALLWFTSSFAPDINPGTAALAKLSGAGGAYVQGNVLVPIPEPMTAILLSVGWLAVRSYRRQG